MDGRLDKRELVSLVAQRLRALFGWSSTYRGEL